MCILLNVKKHEKTFALNVDIFSLRKGKEILAARSDPCYHDVYMKAF